MGHDMTLTTLFFTDIQKRGKNEKFDIELIPPSLPFSYKGFVFFE